MSRMDDIVIFSTITLVEYILDCCQLFGYNRKANNISRKEAGQCVILSEAWRMYFKA